jgi:4-amino-4-deoxy-L-arabinose transferase-like glycosyltransferase
MPIVIIMLVAAALRLIALDRVPPAICQDEAVNAYDACCILKTGADHYGTRWPVFFRSFGDYHAGLPIYLQIPFQMVLGMNVWSTRLPDALFGMLHVFLTYLLARRFYGNRVGLWAAAFLAVSPWHIHLSRLAFGISIALCLTTLGVYLLATRMSNRTDRGTRPAQRNDRDGRKRIRSLGLPFWTYHSMVVFVPALVSCRAFILEFNNKAFTRRPRGRFCRHSRDRGWMPGNRPVCHCFDSIAEQVCKRGPRPSRFFARLQR